MSLTMNAELHDVCEFHAGLILQALMGDAMVATHKKHDNDASAGMVRQCIENLNRITAKLEEELKT